MLERHGTYLTAGIQIEQGRVIQIACFDDISVLQLGYTGASAALRACSALAAWQRIGDIQGVGVLKVPSSIKECVMHRLLILQQDDPEISAGRFR